jgi:Spy/CpxP family protein refolding chaperone
MGKKLPWALFLISLAVNISIIAGLRYGDYDLTGRQGERGAKFTAAVERLGLSDAEKAGLEEIRDWVRERRGNSNSRAERQENRRALLAVIGAESFDQAAFEAGLEMRFAGRRQLFTEFAERFHAYLQTLPPEKHQAFLAAAEERGFMRGLFGRPRRAR